MSMEERAREARDKLIGQLLDLTHHECCGYGHADGPSAPAECCGIPDNIWNSQDADAAMKAVADFFDTAILASLRAAHAEGAREMKERAAGEVERVGPKEGAAALITQGFAAAIRALEVEP